jgi:hypothetical protein
LHKNASPIGTGGANGNVTAKPQVYQILLHSIAGEALVGDPLAV